MKKMTLRLLVFAVFVASLIPSSVRVASAQNEVFQVGEKVEFKPNQFQDVWEEGTIVKVYPPTGQGLKQVLIRHKSPYNPQYFPEEAYDVKFVRHLDAHPANHPAAPVENKNGTKQENGQEAKQPPANAKPEARGVMPKAEIIGYMRAHGYANGRPKHDGQVCRDLIAQIKRRGVEQRLEVGKDDLSPFADNGCFGAEDTDVVKATQLNIGPPTTLGWLYGTWGMTLYSGPNKYVDRESRTVTTVDAFAKLGSLTIKGDGTYVWRINPSDPPAKYVKGRWRKATAQEMGLQGGAGIVLQKAADGADWIAFKYMDPFNKAERIDVQHLQYRGAYRRIGWRK
jgi:hypothetical protein